MSDKAAAPAADGQATSGQATTARPERKKFPNKFTTARLSRDAAERQSKVTRMAWEQLGGKDGATAFLNTHDDALGGRPLDLAVGSAAGLDAVERAIADKRSRLKPGG